MQRDGSDHAQKGIVMASHVQTTEQATEYPVGYASTQVTHETLALDTDIYLLLRPKTVPINSPSRIPSEALRPFLNQEKELLCIGDDKHVIPASLSEARMGHLVAQVKDSKGAESFLLWHGGIIVVLFPVSPQLHYVLEVQVEEVSSTEVCLQYLDPRAQERFIIELADPVQLSIVSPATILQMLSGQVDIIREITTTSPQDASSQAGGEGIVRLNDRLHWQEDMDVDVESSDIQASVNTTASLRTQARDISVGGMRLAYAGNAPDDFCEGALTQVSITLPVQGNRPVSPDNALGLRLLAIIRGVHSSQSTTQLHLRFVQRLPDSFEEYFAQFRLG